MPQDHKQGALGEFVEVVKTVVYALLIALVLRVLLFQPFTIPSASMEPTLLEGDYIIVSKYSYGWSRNSIPFSPPLFKGRLFERPAERGDVVVFKLPRDGHTDYIKRLIGLPGDRVQMKAGQIYINGVAVPHQAEAPVKWDVGYGYEREVGRFKEELPGPGGATFTTQDFGPDGEVDNTPVFVVPQGNYFMMGDNRDNSLDSRWPEAIGVGFVPAENLIGRPRLILVSWKGGAEIFKPWTWFLDARPSRFLRILK